LGEIHQAVSGSMRHGLEENKLSVPASYPTSAPDASANLKT